MVDLARLVRACGHHGQGYPLDVLHGQVGAGLALLRAVADLEHLHDVAVREARHQPGLVEEDPH